MKTKNLPPQNSRAMHVLRYLQSIRCTGWVLVHDVSAEMERQGISISAFERNVLDALRNRNWISYDESGMRIRLTAHAQQVLLGISPPPLAAAAFRPLSPARWRRMCMPIVRPGGTDLLCAPSRNGENVFTPRTTPLSEG